MKHIADRAGVSIGTVYHHFPTLDRTVQACGEMVMATFPPPGEEVLAGAVTLRDRAFRLARALWAHLDEVIFDRVRPDQHLLPIVGEFVAREEAHRIELTRAALAPFAVDRDLIRIIAALLDIEVYRGLQRAGLSLDLAATAIADVIHARVTRKG
jgi:AcrR family transcriptional regulator